MIKAFFLVFFLSFEARALDAVITVLEAPLFREKDYNSPVVQYKRKGDIIKVHPSLANTTKYDHMAPSPEMLKAFQKKAAFLEDEFIPTLDRQGKTAYVLSDHIYVYLEDSQELTQTIPKKDPTDYRLEEPLPKNYPLDTPKGYRGQFLLGFAQPYTESYPYPTSVKTKGYMSPIDVTTTLLRQVSYHTQDRFYFGGSLNFRTFQNTFSFLGDGRTSEERGVKLGLGPTISYDAYKGTENRVSLQGTIMAYFFNQLDVTQKSSEVTESRGYRSWSLSPRISLQYHRKSILEEIDFVVGTSMEMETPMSYKAQDGAGQTGWWQGLGNDEFSTRTTFNLAIFAGIQSAY